MASDADTLDQLLQLQLRVVDQKLSRAKQARADGGWRQALQPTQAARVQQPPTVPSVTATHSHVEPEMPWRQQMAAHQHRLDELARRNAELSQECADAQARPPAEPPRRRPEAAWRQAEPSTTESLLQESLVMQRDLMAHLQREAVASEARREDAADEDAQVRARAHTSIYAYMHAAPRVRPCLAPCPRLCVAPQWAAELETLALATTLTLTLTLTLTPTLTRTQTLTLTLTLILILRP